MAERSTPQREAQTQPVEYESPLDNNVFWDRLRSVEELLAEAREILEDLKEGEA